MKSSRNGVLWSLAALLLVAAGLWIARGGEWVEVDVPSLPRGEAARDDLYAAKKLARQLGATVTAPKSFERLPPEGATLVLSSTRWNMFPGRAAALGAWVERGGRLVVFQSAFVERDNAPPWMPIRAVAAPHPPDQEAQPARRTPMGDPVPVEGTATAPADGRGVPGLIAGLVAPPCAVYHEPDDADAPAFGRARGLRVCGHAPWRLTSDEDSAWQLDAADGSVVLRVPVGLGSVASSAIDGAFDNVALLRDDGALAFAALLQLHAGDEVWFVDDERRARFLALLWEAGWPALLLGAAATLLALWRAGVRFGPLIAEVPRARRSVGEQIRRTAAFVAAGGGGALHRAAARALEEQARRSVPHYAALVTVSERSAAVARTIGGDAAALAAAMAPPTAASRRPALAAAIAVLEHARRALLPPSRAASVPNRIQPEAAHEHP